jgi:hypothetical protein
MAEKDIGHIYVLKNEAMPGIYKIGITSRDDLDERINELYTGQTSVPLPFECEFACKVEDYKQVEKIIHNAFADYRINPNREFFRIKPERVIPLLQHLTTEDTTKIISEKINKNVPEIDKEANIRYIKRRPNFNFIEMGINIGEKIVFAKEDKHIEATVISERLVKYNDKEYMLTKLTAELLDIPYSVGPMPHWKYNGKSLQEYYNETYNDVEP